MDCHFKNLIFIAFVIYSQFEYAIAKAIMDEYVLDTPAETKLEEEHIDQYILNNKVDGGLSSWSFFGKCSVECGTGYEISTRLCINPIPQNGGRYCKGPFIRVKKCKRNPCITPKTIKTSSVLFNDQQTYRASNCLDDDLATPCVTAREINPWLLVGFEQEVTISSVKLIQFFEFESSPDAVINILVIDKNGSEVLCGKYGDAVTKIFQDIEIKCGKKIKGNSVKMTIDSKGKDTLIDLKEIKFIAY